MSEIANTLKVLKKLRESRSLSLQDLGDIMGTSKVYIFHVETGRYKAPIDYINKIARELHVTTNEAKELKKAWLDDQSAMLDF